MLAPAAATEYFEQLNRGDWSGLAGLCAEQAELVGGLTGRGRSGVVDSLRSAVESWRRYTERPSRFVVLGGTIVVQSRFEGETGAGLAIGFDAVTALELEDGRIRRLGTWHEPAQTDRHFEVPGVQIVDEYFRSVNEEDWEACGKIWAPDGEMFAAGGPLRRGPTDIVRAYRRFFELFESHDDRPYRMLITGDSATVQVLFRGISQYGGEVELDSVDVIDIAPDGRIQRLAHWHDRDVFHRLFGAPEGG